MEQKGFIKYALIIIVILTVVFLSQQAYSRGIVKTLISDATNQAGAYLAKGSGWVMSNIYSKISGEVQKRGDTIVNEVNQEKNKVSEKISENILKKTEDYFSGVTNSILHPGENNNCPIPANQTSTGK